MLLSRRSFWLATLSLSGLVSSACMAQQSKPQFAQPQIELTGGRVATFLPGKFQPSGLTDILYVNAPTLGANSQVTAGLLLNYQGFTDLHINQVTFPNVTNVTAALDDFDADGHTDAAFALSPTIAGGSNLCISYGTGVAVGQSASFSAMKSACTSFPVSGTKLPIFSYITSASSRSGRPPQIILEDSANSVLSILSNNGSSGFSGTLPGIKLLAQYAIPTADGAGPILTGDFNGDGIVDLVVNGQAGKSASVYLGNNDGTFQTPVRYTFDHKVHSLLLQDMDADGHLDMVVEGDNGIIEIFHGNIDGSFAPTSMGGTSPGLDGFSGNGGHLVAVGKLGGDLNLDLITSTPIGISVLQGLGNMTYKLEAIYNGGPGRSAYALADYDGDGNLDLAIDSAEGVAILYGRVDGSLQTSLAYAAGLPALNASVATFRNPQSNPAAHLDVAVATTYDQGRLMLGDGTGAFTASSSATNPAAAASAGNTWTLLQAGDFNGDGNPDLLYTAVGYPLPYSSLTLTHGISIGYGKGDGTFAAPVTVLGPGFPSDNGLYGQSAIADLNGDGLFDIANVDARYDDTLLGQKLPGSGILQLGLNVPNQTGEPNSTNAVAAGFFAPGRTAKQDLVFQHDADLIPYRNSGDGTHFTAMPKLTGTPNPASLYPATIVLADVDNDGNGDIVATYYNLAATPANPTSAAPNALYIWYGNGDGTFGQPQILTLARNYYLAQVVDMNADGLPDVILSDGYLVGILYNQGARSFGVPLANGELSSEQHFLAGQGINSLSLADVNGDGALDLIVANGGTTLSSPLAIGGLVQSSVALTPNPDVNTGGITVLLNAIRTKVVTGTLTATPDPSALSASFTLTAILTPTSGVAAPTGTVIFSIKGTQVGTSTVVPGTTTSTATYTVPAGNTYQGTLSLTAVYSGDALNSPATLFGSEVIQGLISTTTVLQLCTGPSVTCPTNGFIPSAGTTPFQTMYYGQTFNGTATASAIDGSLLTGVIDFNDTYNGVFSTLCVLPIGNMASCPAAVGTTIGTSVGTNVFTAVYTGDTTHSPSTSNTITITVLQDTNAASLTGSPNPSPVGQPVTFAALFSGNFAPPAGLVVFTFGGVTLGSATLVPGPGITSTATFTTATLPVGSDTVVASYAATLDFAAASASTVEVITPLVAATTTLTSSLNPSTSGQPVTFTATVSAANGTPTGSVTFLDGSVTLGVQPVGTSGVATFTTSTLTVGSHTITANYGGSSLAAASSASLIQIVNPLPTGSFTVSVTPSPVTVAVGNTLQLVVTVTALNGYNQPVNLTCAGLPIESTCTFIGQSIPAGGGQTQLLLTTMAPHDCNSSQPYFVSSNPPAQIGMPTKAPGKAPFAAPILAGLIAAFGPGRRRWLRALFAMIAIAGLTQMTGCGNCTDLGTRPNTYTIQVTGTATAGPTEVESTPVVLTVTL